MRKKLIKFLEKLLRGATFCFIMVLTVFLVGCTDMSARSDTSSEPKYVVYNCDVKKFKLSTTIQINKDGEKYGKVEGNILTLVEDPLTLYDSEDNKIGYAGDAYKYISQDSHGLYLNGEFKYDMVGQIDIWGETYELYDSEEEMLAKAKFNGTSTRGTLYDNDNNIIATYESGLFSSDFNIRIESDCKIEDEVVIMLFASYYSDYNYDNN